MRYEHLIQVTDPQDPRVAPMGRETLWRGLLARVHAPERFPFGPDACTVEAEAPGADGLVRLRRSLAYGALRLHDRVELQPGRCLRFRPEPRADMPRIVLSIAVEEPATGLLCLRFVYESPPEGDDPEVDGLRQQAWLAADRDMVRTLRSWQAQGRL